jgi:hypothetical protein
MSEEEGPDSKPADELRAMARIYRARNKTTKAFELLQLAEQIERHANNVIQMHIWREKRSAFLGNGDK